MKTIFFKFIFGILLVLKPVKATNDIKEEIAKFPQFKPTQQVISHIGSATIEDVPNETLFNILRFLDINDLGRVSQASRHLKRASEDPALWRHLGSKHYSDYLMEEDFKENPRQKIIFHALSVIVNASEDLENIARVVGNYRLNLYVPSFKKYLKSVELTNLVTDIPSQKEFIALGNRKVIEQSQKKIEGLEKENLKVIERKIKALLFGDNEYQKDLIEARKVNDFLVEKANVEAIHRKIRGLAEGKYGYEKDLSAARELNELLVKERNLKAIERKINGLLFGSFGYEMNFKEVKEFNELLVKEGNFEAIKRKEQSFKFSFILEEEDEVTSKYEYPIFFSKSDSSKQKEFNEFLVAQGDPKGMWEKIWDLQNGNRGYESVILP